jgi:hypothetical protein
MKTFKKTACQNEAPFNSGHSMASVNRPMYENGSWIVAVENVQ